MLRFAPSPYSDMNIGNLRIAIFNYILSVQREEPLLIRIEDIDQEKNIAGKEKEIFEILGLFGIQYQQQQIQSTHIRFHRAMALQLLQDKKAFNCFCTHETLERKREAAIQNNLPYRYDGTCLALSPEAVIDNENPFSIRFKKPSSPIMVKDIIKGDSTFSADEIDSFIILTADKNSTYNFACAVDDMLADVSLVIRGEDHLSDTPRQMAIHKALGYDKNIEYAHLPVILNDDGNTMSDCDEVFNVKWLLEEGYMPEAITNYLISLGTKTPCEIFSLNEAIKWFDLKSVSKTPVKFDLERLQHLNREHLKGMDPKELSRYVGFADEEIGRLAKLYLEEVSTLKELRVKIQTVFSPKNIADEHAEICKTLRELTLNAPHFDDYGSYQSYLVEHSGLKEENFIKPLRMLLSGSQSGPDLSELYNHIKNYIKEVVK